MLSIGVDNNILLRFSTTIGLLASIIRVCILYATPTHIHSITILLPILSMTAQAPKHDLKRIQLTYDELV